MLLVPVVMVVLLLLGSRAADACTRMLRLAGPPTTSPAHGETDVPPSSWVWVLFDGEAAAVVELRDPTGQPVAATRDAAPVVLGHAGTEGTLVVLTPDADLLQLATYSIVVVEDDGTQQRLAPFRTDLRQAPSALPPPAPPTPWVLPPPTFVRQSSCGLLDCTGQSLYAFHDGVLLAVAPSLPTGDPLTAAQEGTVLVADLVDARQPVPLRGFAVGPICVGPDPSYGAPPGPVLDISPGRRFWLGSWGVDGQFSGWTEVSAPKDSGVEPWSSAWTLEIPADSPGSLVDAVDRQKSWDRLVWRQSLPRIGALVLLNLVLMLVFVEMSRGAPRLP